MHKNQVYLLPESKNVSIKNVKSYIWKQIMLFLPDSNKTQQPKKAAMEH